MYEVSGAHVRLWHIPEVPRAAKEGRLWLQSRLWQAMYGGVYGVPVLVLMAVGAAEIGSLGVLARLDDGAADGAGAGEERFKRRAVVPPDHALERGEILREAAEHLQDRLLVVEKHIAPHDGILGGDAGEVAEAAGGELD